MMRRFILLCAAVALIGGAGLVRAEDRGIEQLPQDVGNLALVWAEPLKEVPTQTRRSNPINGLWLGLVSGSIETVGNVAGFFASSSGEDGDDPILRYSF